MALAALPDVPTPQHPTTNIYHATQVVDNYQWLEQATNADVREWTRLQNERTGAYFGRLPFRLTVAEELKQMSEESSANYSSRRKRGDRVFALRFKPPQQQPVLIHFPSVDRLFRRTTILDLNRLNTNGTTTIDWFEPSWDGRLVAVSLSEGGSEGGSLHFYESDTGRKLPDVIPHVIEDFEPSAKGFYVADLLGGPYQIRYFRRGSRKAIAVPTPPISGAYGLRCWEGDELLFWSTSYTDPGALLAYRPEDKQARATAIRAATPVRFDDIEVVREFAQSRAA